MANDISWTVIQSVHNGVDTVSDHREEQYVIITEQETQVSTPVELLFIDYADMLLYRLDRLSGECSVFSAVAEKKGGEAQKVLTQMISLLAGYTVNENDEYKKIQGLQCSKKTVIMGAGMFHFRTVAPKTIEYYGELFSEGAGEYWVSTELNTWQTLQKFVQKRQDAFAVAPLLRRMDPLGLMAAVKGFPVQGWQKSGKRLVEQTLVSIPAMGDSPLQLPQECRRE